MVCGSKRSACGKPASSCGKKASKSSCSKPKPACGSRGKSCKPGKITRNAFLNFLRTFRTQHCGWPVTKIAVEGARCWCKMSAQEKEKYICEAQKAPKMKRKHHKHRGKKSCGGRRGRRR